MTQYILIAGNFSDGFHFHGPFDSFSEAANSPEAKFIPGSWVATLLLPTVSREVEA